MKKTSTLTPAYAAIQATFWMSWCCSVGFAAVYLQGLGYSNAGLGLVTAAGSLFGALLGPGLSSLIDRRAGVSAAKLVPPTLAAEAASLLVLLLFPSKGVASSLGFAGYILFVTAVNSLFLKLYSDAAHRGLQLRKRHAALVPVGAGIVLRKDILVDAYIDRDMRIQQREHLQNVLGKIVPGMPQVLLRDCKDTIEDQVEDLDLEVGIDSDHQYLRQVGNARKSVPGPASAGEDIAEGRFLHVRMMVEEYQ